MAKETGGQPSSSEGGKVRVLVELRVQKGRDVAFALNIARSAESLGFQLDPSYKPVPVGPSPGTKAVLDAAREETVVVRGTIDEDRIKDLEDQPNVVKVWKDTPIAPFASKKGGQKHLLVPTRSKGNCPLPPCDCSFGDPATGSMEDVARYLGVDKIWAVGYRGEGIAIGIVDGGITATGRTPRPGETARIKGVVDGWPDDWGTTAESWGDHGNMTATDALGMAPAAEIYDIRISDDDAISMALAGFQWAIEKHRATGKPQILSNSWGIFQEAWDPDYARNPEHPFTRKVIDALREGILVLFAAGNCGGTCPDGRCEGDKGPGKSIWGANGHPSVITVGAANIKEKWVGYSSQGPAALDPQKPDFCSITHFEGYFPNLNPDHSSDGGTSAATPIAAGVVALFKQANPALTQDRAKDVLKQTAKNIGPAGWDQHSGSGIIQAKAAFDLIKPEEPGDLCRKKYAAYLHNVLMSAHRHPRLHACLCYHLCGTGNRPSCSILEVAIAGRVVRIMKICPQLKDEFCKDLNCAGMRPGTAAPVEEVASEMLEAELELALLEGEKALPEREIFEAEMELALLEEKGAAGMDMFEAEMELAALVETPCTKFIPFLKRVIEVADSNQEFRRCLCYYLCRTGERPVCTKEQITVLKRVFSILSLCPHYIEPICRRLQC